MSKADEKYSQYTQHLSAMTSASALIAGFVFTIITWLLTQLPIVMLNSFLSQVIFIILYALFELLLYLIVNLILMSFFLTTVIPPRSKQVAFTNILWGFTIISTGFVPILLFLLWGLIFLVFAALIIWIFFLILSMFHFVRPFLKRPS